MALIITLIMLSITLIMAIAFLAVAKRERVAVSTSTDTTVARLATDTAQAAAMGQILATINSSSSALYNYSLLVSTNYINSYGFVPGIADPTNVNFDYTWKSTVPFAADLSDRNQDIANLLYLPRAPVMISAAETNGRFYLDLNRNGTFEDTGTNLANAYMEAGTVVNGNQVTGLVGTNGAVSLIGDPQWVGVLERPGIPHGPDNQFVSRYAFIALPVGQALDINAIDNQTLNVQNDPQFTAANFGAKGYFRNQGVGSWEINFAAFLADLNTNQWDSSVSSRPPHIPYYYGTPFGNANAGDAFMDAYWMLGWRYNYNSDNLYTAGQLLGSPNAIPPIFAANVLPFDNIDSYSDGPLQTTTTNIVENFFRDNTALPWSGSDNVNRYFTLADLFDPTKSSGTGLGTFTNRLLNAGTTADVNGAQPVYDRYTFYRMLQQLGTDSLPANAGKLNLNYQNAIVNYDSNGGFLNATVIPEMETNLYAWNPRDFFCAAADQMLKTYTTNWFQGSPSNYLATYYGYIFTNYVDANTGFGLTNVPYYGMTNQIPAFGLANIPVQVNGQYVYSSAVNRVLQLAANIFDAGTNDFYPHVFRPTFLLVNQLASGVNYENMYINGFEQIVSVTGVTDSQLQGTSGPYDINTFYSKYGINTTIDKVNVYGLPWIIGAKKGMPNFEQFYSYNTMETSRKLQFNRTTEPLAWTGAAKSLYSTNQLLIMSITNHIGFSFWNSYSANYAGAPGIPGQPTIYAEDFIHMRLSSGGYSYSLNTNFTYEALPNPWYGSAWNVGQNVGQLPGGKQASPSSFIPGTFDFPFVYESALNLDQNGNMLGFRNESFAGTPTTLPAFPDFEEDTTNWFQAYILDNGHVLDYVQFTGPSQVRYLGSDLKDLDSLAVNPPYMWSTNLSGSGVPPTGVNWGVAHQINVSQTGLNIPAGAWQSPPNMPPGVTGKPNEAANFEGFFTATWTANGKTYINTNLNQQAPFTPTRTVVSPALWQVNDPLVHYLSSDLNTPVSELGGVTNGVAKSDTPGTPPVAYPPVTSAPPRYQPWGINSEMNGIIGVLHDVPENGSYNLSYRDPLVYSSDNWDFPTNKYPSVGWLGRVHRGTPWQTVYLKSTNLLAYVDVSQSQNPNVGKNTWYYWTGDFNAIDAANARPVVDELLFDVFTAAPNDNASRGALSVNQTHLAAWSAVLSGVVVISNATPGIPSALTTPVQTNLLIQPAGTDIPNSAIAQILTDINNLRTNTVLFPLQAFTHVGHILEVPSLTLASPFLNQSDLNHVKYDISDEMYEQIPQQILGLLRPSGVPRYVVYAWGQTLKPAPDGTVLQSGPFFGLVTNYQVVAESATRTVMTVQPVVTNAMINDIPSPVTNYNVKVESFNVLPPE